MKFGQGSLPCLDDLLPKQDRREGLTNGGLRQDRLSGGGARLGLGR